MLDRSMLPKMRQVVSSPTMFYSPDHATIWRALCDLYDRNEPIDAVILRAELEERRGELEHCGGVAYLAEVLASVPSAAHGVHYAGIVRDAAIRSVRADCSTCMAAGAAGRTFRTSPAARRRWRMLSRGRRTGC